MAEEAQAFRCFQRFFDATHLRDYLKRLPDFEDVEAEERALRFVRASRNFHDALWFLVHWPDLDRAANLVVTRAGELDGDLYEFLVPAAEALDAKHPLAATLIRRALIDFTLTAARSRIRTATRRGTCWSARASRHRSATSERSRRTTPTVPGSRPSTAARRPSGACWTDDAIREPAGSGSRARACGCTCRPLSRQAMTLSA